MTFYTGELVRILEVQRRDIKRVPRYAVFLIQISM